MTEARRRANAKWSRANMTVVGCKVTKEKAQIFKDSCAALGVVPNRILLQAVDDTIAEAEKNKAGE